MYKAPLPYLKPIDYLAPNPLDFIHTPFISLLFSLSPKHDFVRPIDYHVTYDHSLDLGHVGRFLNMFKENVVNIVKCQVIFGRYDPTVDHCHAYLDDTLRRVVWSSMIYHSTNVSKAFDKF